MSLSWVTLAAIVIIGIFSLFSLWMGFQSYSSDTPENAFSYIVVGTAGFAAIGYMFFRTRAVNTVSRKQEAPIVEVITTLECPSCNLKRVRDFKRGDYIFKNDEPCNRCEGNMVIKAIHKRPNEKKRS
jgi:hypothetical protein